MRRATGGVGAIRLVTPQADAHHSPIAFRILTLPFVQQLPPEMQGQMDPTDPQGMAQGMQQAAQQNPNVLQQVWNNPMGKIAAVGIAGFAAKEILSHR